MSRVRPPAVAGRFYPADAGQLRQAVQGYLAEAVSKRQAGHAPLKAIIAPHAGYVYSGPVAGSGYAELASLRGQVRRVVLLGPAHYVAFQGIAAPETTAFATPLGEIPVDTQALATLQDLPQVGAFDEAHTPEHSLEVHLPFLQETLGDFKLVPLLVGQTDVRAVAEVVERLWGGPETLFVISSDLSHYHDHATAQALDRETSRQIEQMQAEALRGDRACGCRPIGGLLDVARRQGLSVRTLDLRNSGDTAGPRDRVVGYGAYVVEGETNEPGPLVPVSHMPEHIDELNDLDRERLLELAETSIEHGLEFGRPVEVDPAMQRPALQHIRATFVTLKLRGQLRGCMGTLSASDPLAIDVASNAFAAAFKDPRFPPLRREEFPLLDVSISVLSHPESFAFDSESDLIRRIRPGVDGLILVEGNRRGTLLPSVWEMLPHPLTFLHHLKQKAGLPAAYWSDTIRIYRYTSESFGRTHAERSSRVV